MALKSSAGLEIEQKFDLPNQIFFANQSISFFTCQQWLGLVCCGNECSHDRDLLLVLLPYTKLVYLTVVILHLYRCKYTVLPYLDSKTSIFLLKILGRS